MTQPGAEKRAAMNAERQGFSPYLPQFRETLIQRRRSVERIRYLFPRYMFVEVIDRWFSLLGTFGVSRVLMNDGKPEPIDPRIIEHLKSCHDDDGFYVFPDPAPLFAIGQKLRATEGLMAGTICLCRGMSARDRVRVLFQGVGFEFNTEMDAGSLQAA